jgi:hypothetical protein
MGCAKCHTHKYDPISHREYYSFLALFNQTEDADRSDEAPTIEMLTPAEKERGGESEGTDRGTRPAAPDARNPVDSSRPGMAGASSHIQEAISRRSKRR